MTETHTVSDLSGPLPDSGNLTRFQLEVLYVLGETGGGYGLGIKRILEERYDMDINHGHLYPNLDRLIKAGLVDKHAYDKRTNIYELTEKGRDLIQRDAAHRAAVVDGIGGED